MRQRDETITLCISILNQMLSMCQMKMTELQHLIVRTELQYLNVWTELQHLIVWTKSQHSVV